VANFGERYELIRQIGAGGMGEVWLAHDEQLAGRPVAIKIMHKHMLPNPADVARFEREAQIAAAMDHPNIVTVYTTGNYDGAPFMVMEYLRGQDLERAQPDGGASRVAAIGRDVCAALAYAHGKGVIHRDIKPGNLFLCDTGQVKVTDFGIARAMSGTTLSAAGSLVGTFAYMPPEQWRGAAPAFSNDVWATGCVLYRLLSGRPPRVFPDAAGYAAAALRGDPVPGLREVSGAPAWLADAVMAMLDPDPARRPPAADCVRLLSGMPALAPAAVAAPVGQTSVVQPPFGQPPLGQPPVGQPPVSHPFVGQSPVGQSPVGQSPVGQSPVGQPGGGWAGSFGGVAGESPDTIAMTRTAAARAAADRRPRRPGRVAAVIGAVLALLIAGSLVALRLHGSPQSPGSATGSTSAPAVSGAGTAPATSPAAKPGSTAAATPAHASSASRSATPTASATASAPAATAPALVPVPNVVGMTFAKARQVLVDDGFKVAGRHARLGQTVTSVSPSGQAPAGSVIVVVYGTGL
jgi:Protein kinase domain/PASTA domain